MRELAFGNPYVRPNVAIPPGMWAMYREGYYAAICAALRNMQSVLDARNDRRRAQIKAALAKRKAARSPERVLDHVGETLGMRVDHVVQSAEQRRDRGEWKHHAHDTVIVRDTHRDPERAGLSVEEKITFHVDDRGNVHHSAEYHPAPIDTQEKT